MMQTQQLRRRSCWGMWIGAGATLGGMVVGAVAFGVWLLQPGSGLQTDQLWGWLLIAIAVSSAVAAVAGWSLWRETFDY